MFHRIISNKVDSKRREYIKIDLKNFVITPFFFVAIMGKILNATSKTRLIYAHTPLSLGEIGCSLSHLEVYKYLLESSYNSIFIFEDDIKINCSYKEIKKLLNKSKLWFDSLHKPTVLLFNSDEVLRQPIHHLNEIYSIHPVTHIWRTHAYLINRAAAQKIIELQTPLKFSADDWKQFYLYKGIKLYTISPSLIDADVFTSTIDSTNARETHSRKAAFRTLYNNHLKSLSYNEKYNYFVALCNYKAHRLSDNIKRAIKKYL